MTGFSEGLVSREASRRVNFVDKTRRVNSATRSTGRAPASALTVNDEEDKDGRAQTINVKLEWVGVQSRGS